MSIIYLDQWVYVNLLQACVGSPTVNPEYEEICKIIIESSQKDNNKFPFSSVHFIESMNRVNLSSRKELLKFIFDLSKFYSIKPFYQVINMEVRNAILKSLNVKPMDLSDYVCNDELFNFFGGKMEIKPNEPNKENPDEIKEIKEKLSSEFKNSEFMANALCENQTIFDGGGFQRAQNFINEFNRSKEQAYSHPDKTMRKKISTARIFKLFIQDEIIKVCSEYNLDSSVKKNIFSDENSREEFLKSIPTVYVFQFIYDILDKDRNHTIESNDIWDLTYLAVAVPYCDIVVTERRWSNILNEGQIGEMYGTKIISKIKDLSEFI